MRFDFCCHRTRTTLRNAISRSILFLVMRMMSATNSFRHRPLMPGVISQKRPNRPHDPEQSLIGLKIITKLKLKLEPKLKLRIKLKLILILPLKLIIEMTQNKNG
ncbi:unnamed protein product [Nesidiocoris tenuis]|uniref:Uncharacterized protein n=1 Tax=Nesidiocoris tenuis TaxID=355587 RepID=A0A6H5HBH6_9HEMI|nr:unnamed protein product [Nesidiocoris tenuis]